VTSRLPHLLDSQLTDGGKVVSPTRHPTMCVQYYIILIYCITFIANNLIALWLGNNVFIICYPHFAVLIHSYFL
jgi:hypothetical protein